MSRLRATTASSEEDRVIATHLDRASREIEQALRVASKSRKGSGGWRARRVARDLSRALAVLEEVGSIVPRIRPLEDDPDHISEDDRNRLAREVREAQATASGEGDG